ncbi:Aste57867_10800 [Aphanomyces stellatus]|uniref:Aste57867_10800 protein n=1 Tax=Aphanomyces stellatus TaxID=120398 RepID=A0A485KRC8_9STRA|nr:hypothetical protein As57867_010760 [Aphanomyces stellatus]VFT87669.1 Aste57867_10800 [Aphanomyces stellatus]
MEKECLARKLHRERARENRRMQQEHFAYLRAKVEDLTRVLATKTSPLPWHDVARALADDAMEATLTNKELKRRVREGEKFMRIFAAWTASSQMGQGLAPHFVDWRQHALLHTGESRVQSFVWLTERMFHNTDQALTQSDRFGALTTSLVEPTNDAGCAHVVMRSHRVVCATVAECTEVQRRIYFDDWPTREHHISEDQECLRSLFGGDALYVHFPSINGGAIYRLFESPTRTVVVTNTIVHDSARSTPLSGDVTMMHWFVMDRIDDHTTRMVDFSVVTLRPLASRARYAEYLAGVDVEAMNGHACFEALKQVSVSGFEKSHWVCERLFFDTLASVQEQQSTE